MVKSGHDDLEQRSYRNPARPGAGLEILSLADLAHRLSMVAFRASHRLDFHQITLISSGSGTATIDFTEHSCQPGTLLYVRPGQVQRLPAAARDTAAGLHGSIALFTSSFPRDLDRISAIIDDRFGAVSWSLPPAEHRRFRRAMADLATEYRQSDNSELDTELLRQLLNALLLRIARLPRPGGADPASPKSRSFCLFQNELERSFAATRHAHDYAAQLGCSLRTLTRTCQAATGHTAKELIDARVALEAKRLLVHTDLPAETIGRRLGFTEATNFSKFFAREASQTPGRFRAAQSPAEHASARSGKPGRRTPKQSLFTAAPLPVIDR